MRKLLLILFVVLFVACGRSSSFVLEGVITDAEDGERVCLSYPVQSDGIWRKQCDTTYIDGGRFRFEGEVNDLVSSELTLQNMDYVQIFLEPSKIRFSAERNALYDYSLSGLSAGNDLQEYRRAFAEYERAVYEKSYEAMRKNEVWLEASNAGLPNVDDLWAEFYAVVMEHHAISNRWPELAVEFVKSNPNNVLVPHIIDGLVCNGYDEQVIDSLVNSLLAEQLHSTLGELMTRRRELLKLGSGQVGDAALDFTLSAVAGGSVTLSESYDRGYVLLDFWASWCGPCIDEIPKLRQLHSKCGDKLQIISISVDKDEADWRSAVERLNLTGWPQLIVEAAKDTEDYYFPQQADLSLAYGVEQIPCFILVDKMGIIVGRWSHLTAEAVAEISIKISQASH